MRRDDGNYDDAPPAPCRPPPPSRPGADSSLGTGPFAPFLFSIISRASSMSRAYRRRNVPRRFSCFSTTRLLLLGAVLLVLLCGARPLRLEERCLVRAYVVVPSARWAPAVEPAGLFNSPRRAARRRRRRQPASGRTSTATTTTTTSTALPSLIPLEAAELDRLLALGSPTAAQYSAYFGRTGQERYARLVESAIVGFLGVFFSYFLSFVLGGWVATVCGTLFLFWGILSPDFKARQRNWEFLGGRPLADPPEELVVEEEDDDGFFSPPWQRQTQAHQHHQGLFGAMFVGVVEDACVVQNADDVREYGMDQFAGYRMEGDELERFTGVPWLLRVKCVDSTARRLQVHARLSEEYLDIRVGAGVLGILLSKSPDFTTLAAITDLFCPSAECWIGDYPYLDRAETERILAENDNVWDAFVLEEESALPRRDAREDYLETEEENRILS